MSKYLSNQMLSGQLSFWANDFLGNRLSGQMSFWANVVWANVSGQMTLGKCRVGKCHETAQTASVSKMIWTPSVFTRLHFPRLSQDLQCTTIDVIHQFIFVSLTFFPFPFAAAPFYLILSFFLLRCTSNLRIFLSAPFNL
jgi:hypothetical protein